MNAFQIYNSLTAQDFTTVSAVFLGATYAPGYQKTYTYKIGKETEIAAGDYAVIMAPGDKLKVVKIVEVHDAAQIDHSATFLYKWVISVFNTTDYNERIKSEAEKVKLIKADMQTKINETALDEAKALLTDGGQKIISRL